MTPEQLAALQAPNAVKDTSIIMVRQFLFPQLAVLALMPAGIFVEGTGIMHAQGSGPGGTYTEDELKAMGAPFDLPMFVQYTLTGRNDANGPMLFDAADAIRILQGYRGDTAIEPDPNFWYIDRVRKLFNDSFQGSISEADNTMLSMPTVRQAVQDVLTSTIGGGPKPMPITAADSTATEAPPFIIGIVYHGPASQQAIDILASILGSPARGMGHAVLKATETLYLARVKDATTETAILAKLKASPNADLFDLADFEASTEHLESASRTTGALPFLTA
jgi:hypothetical protein